MKRALAGLLAVGTVACAPQVETPSHAPDFSFTLKNVDQACVRGALVRGLATQGFTGKNASDNEIIVERPASPSFASAVQQSSSARKPVERLIVVLRQSGDSLLVAHEFWIVANPGSRQQQFVRGHVGVDEERVAGVAKGLEAKCAKRS